MKTRLYNVFDKHFIFLGSFIMIAKK